MHALGKNRDGSVLRQVGWSPRLRHHLLVTAERADPLNRQLGRHCLKAWKW
jgi:hypothetical protein